MFSTSTITPLPSANGYANGGNLLIAATGNSSNHFAWSSDNGTTWKTVRGTAGGFQPVSDVAFGSSKYFFTTNSNNSQFYTNDLKVSVPNSFSDVYTFVAFGAGRFVAARSTGGNMEYITSTDGITWSSPSTVNGVPVVSFGFFGDRFVAFGGLNGGSVTHSLNGLSWSPAIATGGANSAKSIEFQGGNWLLFSNGTSHRRTTNFSTFTTFTTTTPISCVSSTASRVYIGRGANIVEFSTDQGTTWSTPSTIPGGAGVDGVIEFGGTVYANVQVDISGATYNKLFSETAPNVWADEQILSKSQPNNLSSSAFGSNAFKIQNSRVFVSVGSTVAHSTDMTNWEYVGPEGNINNRRQILYVNNKYYAFDTTGTVGEYDSATDTWTWKRLPNLQLPNVGWAQFTNNQFIVLPSNGDNSPAYAFASYSDSLTEIAGVSSIPLASLPSPGTVPSAEALIGAVTFGENRWYISFVYESGGVNRYRTARSTSTGVPITSPYTILSNDGLAGSASQLTNTWFWETEPATAFFVLRSSPIVTRINQTTNNTTSSTGITSIPQALIVSNTNWHAVINATTVASAASPNWLSYSNTTVPSSGLQAKTWWNGNFYYVNSSTLFRSSTLGGTYSSVGTLPFNATVLF
jgi:hypothetical protein